MKIAVPSYQVRSGYMPVCWSGTSLFEILDPPLTNLLQCVHIMFSKIQYYMWYEFEMNKTFLSICITKNVILL